MRRRPPLTRVVSYSFNGTIDVEAAHALLEKCRDMGFVTEFDSVKSGSPGYDRVWFNGPPGPRLREIRRAIRRLVSAP